MNDMSKLPPPRQFVADIQRRLGELARSLEGWNLLACLFSESRTTEEDLTHALAIEARELVRSSLRLTFALGEAGMKGDGKRFSRLLGILDQLDARERRLAFLCRSCIQSTAGKERKP